MSHIRVGHDAEGIWIEVAGTGSTLKAHMTPAAAQAVEDLIHGSIDLFIAGHVSSMDLARACIDKAQRS